MKYMDLKSRVMGFGLVGMLLLGSGVSAVAGDLEWSGVYRAEGLSVSNFDLGKSREKSYGLHHLTLRPKIVAADGITIFGRFDILNSSLVPGSAIGDLWGGRDPQSNTGRDALTENQEDSFLQVTELYMTFSQEFGSLIVGRAPLHFGLGMTYNSGVGLFDHWYTNRDLFGYKVVVGNLYLLPMIAKIAEGRPGSGDDITDLILHAQYDNPETDTSLGVYYVKRNTGYGGNDAPATLKKDGTPDTSVDIANGYGGTGAKVEDGYATDDINIYALKDSERFRLGLEAGFRNGRTGVRTVDGANVGFSGYGVAVEYEFRPQASRWKFGLKAGIAAGDDPESGDKYEGFHFHRNYDVAMLLFNQQMGPKDLFRTGVLTGQTSAERESSLGYFPDIEAISNVSYFSPYAVFNFKEKWSMEGVLTSGWLGTDPLSAEVKKDLGYELDLSISYSPTKKITWTNQIGLLFPGAAFKAGTFNLAADFAYGLMSRAAVSF